MHNAQFIDEREGRGADCAGEKRGEKTVEETLDTHQKAPYMK